MFLSLVVFMLMELIFMHKDLDVVNLRKQIGMVFQKSNLFPKTIYENLTFGPNINGIKDKNSFTGNS